MWASHRTACAPWRRRSCPRSWRLRREVLSTFTSPSRFAKSRTVLPGAVDVKWCLVHATHATQEELECIAAAGAVVGLCPITEASLGDGVFPAPELQALRGRLGIGTDSNVLIDAAAELRVLEYSQRLTRRARNVLAGDSGHSTGRSLFDAALAGGSQALRGEGLRAPVGLAPGAPLDLVSLDAKHPALIERRQDELLDSWVFAAGRTVIDCVWRAGEKVVSAGR